MNQFQCVMVVKSIEWEYISFIDGVDAWVLTSIIFYAIKNNLFGKRNVEKKCFDIDC